MTPPMRSIGAFSPESFWGCLFLVCFASAQTKQFSRSWDVISIPDAGSYRINPFLMTNNAGGPDGDVVVIINSGSNIYLT
jgi:hypothetical protein